MPCRETNDEVVEVADLVDVDIDHLVLLSMAPGIRSDQRSRIGPRGLPRHHHPSPPGCDQPGATITRVIETDPIEPHPRGVDIASGRRVAGQSPHMG